MTILATLTIACLYVLGGALTWFILTDQNMPATAIALVVPTWPVWVIGQVCVIAWRLAASREHRSRD